MSGKESTAESETGSGTSRRKRGRPLLFGLLALTLSGLYLLGPARNAMDRWAAGAVLLHIALGFLLTIPVGFVFWRVIATKRKPPLVLLTVTALLCAATGFWLFGRAAMGHSTARDVVVWWTHILVGLLAVAGWLCLLPQSNTDPPAAHIADESSPRPATLPTQRVPSSGPAAPQNYVPGHNFRSVPLITILLSTTLLGAAALLPEYPAKDYYRELTATNAAQAENPLFPAGMRLPENNPQETARRWQEQNAAYCGQNGCHPAAFEEWTHSAHRFAQDDPFYRRVHQDFAARKGENAARWCAGCHAPQTVLPNPPAPFPTSPRSSAGKGEASSLYAAKASPFPVSAANAVGKGVGGLGGVDCVACHATAPTANSRTGNGRFALELPQTYPYAAETGGWKQKLHRFLLRVRPGPHQRAFLKPDWHRSAEFCGTCHRQSFGVAQNAFRFVRGMDTFGEWHGGPFSGRTAQTVVQSETRTCQSCHFPKDSRGHVAHNSPGSNTALPALRGDANHLVETERFLQKERITLDIFALRKEPLRPGERVRSPKPEDWLAPLDAPQETVPLTPGDRLTLDIVVSNRSIGHSFPSGYADIRDAWLEVTLSDAHGRVLLQNGIVPDANAGIPPDTHVYRMVPLDQSGNQLQNHDLDRMTTAAYRRVIPPGGSDIGRYVFALPKVNGPLQIRARLRFRPLRPDFARWVLNNNSVPLPITTLAEASVPIMEARRPERGTQDFAERFVEYGKGLIAPGGPERAAALRAFALAKSLAPTRPEAYVGMGRAYLTEPDFLAARAQFERALSLTPNHAEANHLLGYVLKKQGEYENALRILAPLAERFPQDVILHFDLGDVYQNMGRYAEAAEAFREALAADPDYAPAHYRLRGRYLSLRRIPEARTEEAIGKYLTEDEQAPLLRENYLRNRPDERRAAQPIPRHSLHSPVRSRR